MIMDFGLVDGRSSSGYYAWLLVSAFYIGRGIGAPVFGKVIDKRGRKVGILFWLTAIIIFSLSLGFSTNVQQATLARLFMGLFNSAPAVVKPALNEMWTTKDGKAYAMGIISLYIQIGKAVALFIGGILVHPEKIGFPETSIFVQFPYLLPNFVISFVAILGILAAIFVYEETLQKRKDDDTQTTYTELLKESNVRAVLTQFTIMTVIITCLGKLQVLWFYSNVNDGGFHLDPGEIGCMLGIPSIIALIVQQTGFKKLIAAKGFRWATKIGYAQWIFMLCILPLTSYFQSYKYLVYSAVVVLTIWSNSITFQVTACTNGMINNSTYPENRGKVNAVSTSASSLIAGFFSPIVGILLALACSEGWPFPFNYWLPFFLLAGIAAAASIHAAQMSEDLELSPELQLPESIELKEVENEEETQELVKNDSINP